MWHHNFVLVCFRLTANTWKPCAPTSSPRSGKAPWPQGKKCLKVATLCGGAVGLLRNSQLENHIGLELFWITLIARPQQNQQTSLGSNATRKLKAKGWQVLVRSQNPKWWGCMVQQKLLPLQCQPLSHFNLMPLRFFVQWMIIIIVCLLDSSFRPSIWMQSLLLLGLGLRFLLNMLNQRQPRSRQVGLVCWTISCFCSSVGARSGQTVK